MPLFNRYRKPLLPALLVFILASCGGDSASRVPVFLPGHQQGVTTVPIDGTETPLDDELSQGASYSEAPVLLANFHSYYPEALAITGSENETSVDLDTVITCHKVVSRDTGSHVIRVCPTNYLPLIGQETVNPDIDQIMSRVVYSQAWMATRFRETLAILPDEVLKLFTPISAIFLLGDTRPSFYIPANSGLFLDPHLFAVTNEEWASLPQTDDIRTTYDNELNFMRLFRYKATDDRWDDSVETSTRLGATLTLLHELAHANDFYRYSASGEFPRQSNLPVKDLISYITVGDELRDNFPLESPLLRELAQVMFLGREATEEIASLAPGDVFSAFIGEGGIDLYSYLNWQEDLAMMFEETAAYYFLGLKRYNGFFENLEDPTCDNLEVIAGTESRLSSPFVQPRASFVFNRMITGLEQEIDDFITGFKEETFINQGTNWCSLP